MVRKKKMRSRKGRVSTNASVFENTDYLAVCSSLPIICFSFFVLFFNIAQNDCFSFFSFFFHLLRCQWNIRASEHQCTEITCEENVECTGQTSGVSDPFGLRKKTIIIRGLVCSWGRRRDVLQLSWIAHLSSPLHCDYDTLFFAADIRIWLK